MDDDTYQAKNSEIEAAIVMLQARIHEGEIDGFDIEGVLNLAEYLFQNAAILWQGVNPDAKRRFQKVLFPDGLEYARLTPSVGAHTIIEQWL